MPSPIAHATVGYVIYRIYDRSRSAENEPKQRWQPSCLLLTTVGLSLLPDLDFVLGILMGDLGRFHNNATHSLFAGVIVALCAGYIMKHRQGTFQYWFMLVLLCYELHVIMDFFTMGRGVKILWPFSLERYEPSIKLFYGLHRSDGLISVRHLWTVFSELGFAALLGIIVHWVWKRRSYSA